MLQQTTAQLGMLISLVERIGHIARAYEYGDGSDPREASDALKISIETTVIKATNVIDEILDDKSRWNVSGAQDVHEAIMRALAAQEHKSIIEANEALRRQYPSMLLKPTLFQRQGKWYARYGSHAFALTGVGNTPKEAMNDFDLKYLTQEQEPNDTPEGTEEKEDENLD